MTTPNDQIFIHASAVAERKERQGRSLQAMLLRDMFRRTAGRLRSALARLSIPGRIFTSEARR